MTPGELRDRLAAALGGVIGGKYGVRMIITDGQVADLADTLLPVIRNLIAERDNAVARGVSDVEQRCRFCATQMDPDRPWWWTSYGAACSSPCARDLIRDHDKQRRSW